MSDLQALLDVLAAGGDAATMAIALALFKLERRLHNVEIHVGLKTLKQP